MFKFPNLDERSQSLERLRDYWVRRGGDWEVAGMTFCFAAGTLGLILLPDSPERNGSIGLMIAALLAIMVLGEILTGTHGSKRSGQGKSLNSTEHPLQFWCLVTVEGVGCIILIVVSVQWLMQSF